MRRSSALLAAALAAALVAACGGSGGDGGDTTAPGAPAILAPEQSATIGSDPDAPGQIAIVGTAEALATVEVQIDGATAATTQADGAGSWSVLVTVSEAEHAVRARATDAAGNASALSSARTFTFDATAPGLPQILSPEADATLGTGFATFSGKAEAGATVEVEVDGTAAGTDVAAGDGGWSVTVAVAQGDHAVRARATDVAGNASDLCPAVAFKMDVTPPAAPVIVAPAEGALLGAGDLVGGTSVRISGTAEAGSTVAVQVDGVAKGSAVADGNGDWQVDAAVADGTREVTARATDPVGNESDPSTRSFTLDTEAPASPVLLSPANGAFVGAGDLVGGTSVRFSGTAEAGSTVTVQVDGAAKGSAVAAGDRSWHVDAVVAEGLRGVTTVATDPAGNASAPSASVAFTLDTVPPGVPVVEVPQEGATLQTSDLVGGKVRVSGTADAGATVALFVDDGVLPVGTVVADGAGAWQIDALVDSGPHTVRASAADAARNPSGLSDARGFTLDATRLAYPIPAGGPAPVTSWGQTVPGATGDASGLGEVFPGQANSWALDRDFSLGAGFGLQYSTALALYVGTPTGSSHGALLDDVIGGVLPQFPGDQSASEVVFLTPLFRAADGVVTAAAAGNLAPDVPPINGAGSAYLNGTSASRLSLPLTLVAGRTYTVAWKHQAILLAGNLDAAAPPAYEVVLRDAGMGDVIGAPLFSSSANVLRESASSAPLTGLPTQVVLSFELRSAVPGYVQLDDVTLDDGTGGGPVVIGAFDSGLDGWTPNDGAESQNVRSAARDVGTGASALRITRTFYAPPRATWGRLVDVFENTGSTTVVTSAVYLTILGGETWHAAAPAGAGYLVGWDATQLDGAHPAKSRDVGIVFGQGAGVADDASPLPYAFVVHDLSVPPGGKVALVHFVVQLQEAAAAGQVTAPAGTVAECETILAGFPGEEQYRLDLEPGVLTRIANF